MRSAAVVVSLVLLGGCGTGPVPEAASPTTSAVPSSPSTSMKPSASRWETDGRSTRWVSSYGIEVRVTKDWGYAFGPVRPDCIARDATSDKDPWAHDVPTSPYVEVGLDNRAVPAIGCMPRLPKDLPAAFGALPFALWQPHVTVRRAGGYDSAPGTWHYRGWTLTRARIGRATVTVLASPQQPGLGARVVGSAREIAVDRLGCATVAPADLARMQPPAGRPVPAATEVGSVSVCAYDRTRPGAPLLAAGTSLSGAQARAVVDAIHAAPLGGGPDRPGDCETSMHGDEALVLHFVGRGVRPSAEDPQAFVYSDWCVGNGIVEAGGRHALTRASCLPLYARPPVVLWSTQSNIAPLCMTP